ncbi:MAG: DUF2878 domain-containing protein [Kangiellaceae bacterium]|nr:DUF2878 domain-containing protein [Kangiellaceae bacterium]
MKLNKIINFILFQSIWLACVIGAANNNMISAWILFATLVYWQLFCSKNRNSKDLYFVATLLPMGMVIDSLWVYFKLIEYKELWPSSSLAPYWIGVLWVTFALSLNHSMKWLFDHPKIALIFGALGGPLSYLAAQRLGAIIIDRLYLTLMLLSLAWLLTMGIILYLNKKLDNKETPSLEKANHA